VRFETYWVGDVRIDPLVWVTLVAIVAVAALACLTAWLLRTLHKRVSSTQDMRHVLRKWYANCRELGDPNQLVRTAVIASVPLGDEVLEKELRETVLRADWKRAALYDAFEATGDYRNFQVVDRTGANSALVEVISYYEMWANDTIKFLRELTQSERRSLDHFINEWIPLSAEAPS
jgi:hypothetical protein